MNIATILKDKPKNTKLYSPIFGDVYFSGVENGIIKVIHQGKMVIFFGDGRYYNYPESEPLLFPSKEMRDWSKFAWKKGDVLVSNDGGTEVIFDKWYDDTYTNFYSKHYLNSEDENNIKYNEALLYTTERYSLEDKDSAQTYINIIEKHLGGKLNFETLVVEKHQPEFKDGDIVFMKGIKGGYFANCIFILKGEYKDGDERAFYYAFYNADDKFTIAEYGNTRVHYSLRSATDSKKQQLFDALAKKGKAWDSEKKQVVDLKPNVELKPFDNVLVRHQKTEEWRANIFSHTDKTDEYLDYVCVNGRWEFCIPYEGNESLLGTTKDVED